MLQPLLSLLIIPLDAAQLENAPDHGQKTPLNQPRTVGGLTQPSLILRLG